MKKLDIVQLKDGRTATILEVFDDGKAFLVEVSDETGKALDCPIVGKEVILKTIYSA